jgi:hypothetical protein
MRASKSHTCDIAEALTAWGIHVSGSAIAAGYTSRGSLSLKKP